MTFLFYASLDSSTSRGMMWTGCCRSVLYSNIQSILSAFVRAFRPRSFDYAQDDGGRSVVALYTMKTITKRVVLSLLRHVERSVTKSKHPGR